MTVRQSSLTKTLMIILVLSFMAVQTPCQGVSNLIPAPCVDSLYLALKERPKDSLNGVEIRYVDIKREECEQAVKQVEKDKRQNKAATVIIIICGVVSIVCGIITISIINR